MVKPLRWEARKSIEDPHVFFHCCGEEGEVETFLTEISKRKIAESKRFWELTVPAKLSKPLFGLRLQFLRGLVSHKSLKVRCPKCNALHELTRADLRSFEKSRLVH